MQLTEIEKFLAAALTDEFQPKSTLKKQASVDAGYLIQQVSSKLQTLGISEGNKYMLKRGPNWQKFNEQYGEDAVILGLLAYELRNISRPEKPTNVLPFRRPN